MADDHINIVEDHIDVPDSMLIPYEHLVDIRYSTSIFHIDIPYRYPLSMSDHMLSL